MGDNASISDVRQWEIWQVVWKHEDGTSKARPALSLSTAADIRVRSFVWFVKITGEEHPEVPCRFQLNPLDADFRFTGLDRRSWIHLLDGQEIRDRDLLYKRGHIGIFTAAYITRRIRTFDQ